MKLKDKLEKLKGDLVVIDIETTGLSPFLNEMVCLAMYDGKNMVWLDWKEILRSKSYFKKWVKSKKFIAHNGKFDWEFLYANGIDINIVEDTMILLFMSDENEYSGRNVGLKKLMKEELDIEPILESGEVLEHLNDRKLLKRYNELDVKATWMLYQKFKDKLDEKERKVYNKIEIPLIKVLGKQELRGIRIDVNYVDKIKEDLMSKDERLSKEIKKFVGKNMNLNSSKQLAEYFEREVKKRGESLEDYSEKSEAGNWAMSEWVLEDLSEDGYEVAGRLLELRKLRKLLSTYLKVREWNGVEYDGRVRSSFNMTVAKTGRLSSSHPNLQNIPRGEEIRRMFIADKGCSLISADWSQVEMRLIAHITKDEELLKIFNEGRDVYKEVAKELSISRGEAKPLTLGYAYGMGGDYKDRYMEKYKGVKRWQEWTKRKLEKDGYVRTMFGRKRRLDADDWRAIRQGYNAQIQGSGADLLKLAMIKLEKKLKKGKLLASIHDEVIVECPDEYIEQEKEIVKDVMEKVVKMKVPLKAEIKVGKYWRK